MHRPTREGLERIAIRSRTAFIDFVAIDVEPSRLHFPGRRQSRAGASYRATDVE
jgi:hypothetical protein